MLKRVGFSLVVLSFLSLNVWAEESHESESGTRKEKAAESSQGKEPRPEGQQVGLKDPEAKVLSAVFRIPVNTVKRLYGGESPETSIPKAIDEAMLGDETRISRILGNLFGTLNRKQADVALAYVEDERKKEQEKNPRDSRFLALLDRLFWAGKVLDGKPSDAETAQKFNDSFETAFKEKEKRNEVIAQKIKDALSGNNEAKKFLRENLNRQTLMSFIDAQRKSGNTKLATDLVEAIAFGEPGKEKYIDLYNGKETHRLNLGLSRESMEKALQAYSDAKGGLHLTTVAAKPIASVMREFRLGGDGKIAAQDTGNAQPQGGTPKAGNGGQQTARQEQPAGGNAQAGGRTPGNTGGNTGGGNLAGIISANCNSCHAQNPTVQGGQVVKGGKTYSIPELLTAIDRIPSMRAGVSQAVKDQLRALAR